MSIDEFRCFYPPRYFDWLDRQQVCHQTFPGPSKTLAKPQCARGNWSEGSELGRRVRAFSYLSMSTYSLFTYRTCIVLVDCSERIVAILGGVLPGSRGSDWRNSMDNLTAAVKECSMKSTFTAKEMNHPRGDFTARAAGFSYGGGRERPGNVRITGEGNKAAMDELLNHEDMVCLVGFTNCA